MGRAPAFGLLPRQLGWPSFRGGLLPEEGPLRPWCSPGHILWGLLGGRRFLSEPKERNLGLLLLLLLAWPGCQDRHGALGPGVGGTRWRLLVLLPGRVCGHAGLAFVPHQEAPLEDLEHGFPGLADDVGDALACVHGATVNLVSTSSSSSSSSASSAGEGEGEGRAFSSRRQLQAKDALLGGASIVTQVAWCVLPSRVLLVLTSRKGVQMYESDGSVMVYWQALVGQESSAGKATFARGIAATGRSFICVGISSGIILVFDVPSKGTNITLSEMLGKHRAAITDMGAEPWAQPEGSPDLVTADDVGALCVWRSGERFELISQVPASECPCSSVKLWKGIVAAGYGNGQIRLYEAASGVLRAEVSAHARWIYALDVAPESGKLLSAAEDSFVQVWKLSRHPDTEAVQIEHCYGECVTDTLLCGARFCNPEGTAFAVTGFELSEIIRYVQE